MGVQRQDGSIQSSNLPVFNKLLKNKVSRDLSFYRCMITRVNFTDDKLNRTFDNKQVTYEAVILGGPKDGQIIQDIKAMNDYGGQYNYAEKIYRPLETKNIKDKRTSEHKGDIVFVGFLQGSTTSPIIIGAGTQSLDKTSTGATKADGYRVRKEYNGVFEEINKDGEWELRRKGGTLDTNTGVLTPSNSFEARLKFYKNKMVWEDPKSSMLFEKDTEKWTLKVGSGYTEIADGKGKKWTQTVGTCKVEIDGSSNKITITAGSTILEIDGGSGKISIKGDMVEIGKSVSDFAVLFTELATAFNTHTHMVPQAPAGTLPSMPPLAPLLQTVGSTTVKLQP